MPSTLRPPVSLPLYRGDDVYLSKNTSHPIANICGGYPCGISKTHPIWTCFRKRHLLICISFATLASSVFLLWTHFLSIHGYYDFTFKGGRPDHLNAPIERPMVLRLAIISHAEEFQKRQILRTEMLSGVPEGYINLEYKFFIGNATGHSNSTTINEMALAENQQNNDMVIMDTTPDIRAKNLRKTIPSVEMEDYDYSMTMDSDSFCRLRTLAQRMRYMYPNLNPRSEPILVGNMGRQSVYWENTVSDDDSTTLGEDRWIGGPQYPYPVGIGYMFSSYLAAALDSADPSIPHHIHYPYDDVMIGSWISALTLFHDPSKKFNKPAGKSKAVYYPVKPMPYLPYSVETKIIDDKVGWHDFKNRGAVSRQRPIGWSTACVHRIRPEEIKKLKAMEDIELEWNH